MIQKSCRNISRNVYSYASHPGTKYFKKVPETFFVMIVGVFAQFILQSYVTCEPIFFHVCTKDLRCLCPSKPKENRSRNTTRVKV